MSDWAFIKAAASDLKSAYGLFDAAIEAGNTCWNKDYPGREIPLEDVEQGWLYLLKEEGELIAAFSILPEDDLDDAHIPWTDGNSCVLARLCVRPDRQGKGVAKRVMGCALEQAKALGFTSARFLCDLRNPVALGLYHSLGYESLGRVALYGNDFAAFERVL